MSDHTCFFSPGRGVCLVSKLLDLPPIGNINASKVVICVFTIYSSNIMVSIIANILQVGRSRWTDYLSGCIMFNNVPLESD